MSFNVVSASDMYLKIGDFTQPTQAGYGVCVEDFFMHPMYVLYQQQCTSSKIFPLKRKNGNSKFYEQNSGY